MIRHFLPQIRSVSHAWGSKASEASDASVSVYKIRCNLDDTKSIALAAHPSIAPNGIGFQPGAKMMRYPIRFRPTRVICRPEYCTSSGLTATRTADDASSNSLSTGDFDADVRSIHQHPRAPDPSGPPPLRPTTFEICIGLAALGGLTRLLMMVTSATFSRKVNPRCTSVVSNI